MKNLNKTYLDNLVNKLLNETLEEKADKLVSRIKGEVEETEMDFEDMSDKEIDALMQDTNQDEDFEDDNYEYDFDEMEEGFDSPEIKKFRHGVDYSEKEFKPIKMKPKKRKKFDSDDDERELEPISEGMCNECGGSMNEGECSECGYKMESIYHRDEDEMPEPLEVDEDIYDESEPFGKEQSFDYVEETMNDESEENLENKEFCKYQLENFGENDKRFQEKCGHLMESLKGNQRKLDKNKNNRIDAEDFKLLRKSKKNKKETKENWGAIARAAIPMVASYVGSKMGENNEEVEEGNAFTAALAKTKKGGKFSLNGKTYTDKSNLDDKISKKSLKNKGKAPIKESLELTESQLIDLIEKIIKEEKSFGKPKGLSKYEQVHKADGRENDEYLRMVTKKMKEYLKNGSKGDFEMSPKHFPKGNGELATMKKKAYIPSGAIQDYTDNFTAAGLENLDYDEIHPDEKWVSDNVEGSSRTGNNSEWANSVDTGVNKKRNKIRKDNLLAKLKRKAYKKAPQPIVTDNAGENEGDKIMKKLESINPKEKNKINEEFDKIKSLISYDRKTQ